MKASDNPFPSLLLVEQADTPATPAPGQARLYRGTDNKLYIVDDAGAVAEVGTGGGSSSGGLLATHSYNPATTASVAASTTALADVDATNMAITFTVPASGQVLVRLTGYAVVGGSSTSIGWGLREGTTEVANKGILYTYSGSGEGAYTAAFVISGLTPGAQKTYKWAHRRPTGTNAVYTQAGGWQGPAVMEAWAA